jgi:hypothetical protein
MFWRVIHLFNPRGEPLRTIFHTRNDRRCLALKERRTVMASMTEWTPVTLRTMNPVNETDRYVSNAMDVRV